MPARKRSHQKSKSKAQASEVAEKKKKLEKETEEFVVEKEAGYVLVMGQGDVGQLGLGENVMERKKPGRAKNLDGIEVVQVECGGMHTVALTRDGKVYTWGCNDDGALGRKISSEDGEEFLAGPVELLDDVHIVMVSAGDSHSAALTNDGTVYAWGTYRDARGKVGLTPDGAKLSPTVILTSKEDPIIKIASGNDHTAALSKKGDLFTWGCAEQGQLGRVKACFASRGGRRGLGYILIPKKVRFQKALKCKDVFCGSYASFAVDESNFIYAWGLNNHGQLGTGNTKDGFLPIKIDALSDLVKDMDNSHIEIANGQHHTLFLNNSGKVYSLGRADYGRLGIGEGVEASDKPVHVASLDNEVILKIACGEVVSFAVSDKGDLYSWGMGNCLQLGTGDEDDVHLPTKVQGKSLQSDAHKVIGVSAGGQHTALLVQERDSES